MRILTAIIIFQSMFMFTSCKHPESKESFEYNVDRFADIKILRYQVPGFDELPLRSKKLIYYLSQAALCGRDILYDQHYKYNLEIRRCLEAIHEGYTGDKNTDEYKSFLEYLKRVWFSNGIHHHYSTDKIMPSFSKTYFASLVKNSENVIHVLREGESIDAFINRISEIIFNPAIAAKKVNLNPDKGLIEGSANNFYESLTDKEFETYINTIRDESDKQPVEYIHNSKTIKINDTIREKIWKVDGMYSKAIIQIVYWLTKASDVAENDLQKEIIGKLIRFYQTGDLKAWDLYNITWVKDTSNLVDFINGFIEVYGDPHGYKGTWEAMVNFKDKEATRRAITITDNAQWFEDNSPVRPDFKKEKVKGVSAKVINVVQLGGDVYPTSPIGINLPNSNWIRQEHGSKSVTLANIIHAHHQASLSSGMLEEFCFSQEEMERAKQWGSLGTDLHVDMHEILGHGSGKLLDGVSPDALKNYHSTLEEARADLFSLYYIFDPKLIELGLIENFEVAKAEYDSYIRGGLLTQLTRIELGKDLEESHMRNRQLIASWAFEKEKTEKVIEFREKEGKTYVVINDYERLRNLFGELLAEIQRIKSEGDFEAGKQIVEMYGVKINQQLHAEILERFKKLNIAPYTGFVNPVFFITEENDSIKDIRLDYTQGYEEQMMYYSRNYSFLPTYN